METGKSSTGSTSSYPPYNNGFRHWLLAGTYNLKITSGDYETWTRDNFEVVAGTQTDLGKIRMKLKQKTAPSSVTASATQRGAFVTVSASVVRNEVGTTPTGTVKVTGPDVDVSATLDDQGNASVRFRHRPPETTTYTVAYSGDSTTGASSTTVTVQGRRS